MLLVKDAQEVIEELKQQLGQIKGMVACVECGQEMPIDACYCSSCGAKLVKPKKEEAEDIFEEEDAAAEESTDNETAEAVDVQPAEAEQETEAVAEETEIVIEETK